MSHQRICVIGGGIIGLAVAHKLAGTFPRAQVTLVEKESATGQHQSGHNSGVLHAGLYYKPGSLKAQLAVSGIREMRSFCASHAIPHEVCGKLVVATDAVEEARLRELLDRGTRNGLQGLRWLDRAAMLEVEPHAAGVAAVHVPEEGIVDYPKVCQTLERLIRAAGVTVHLDSPVRRIEKDGSGWRIFAGDVEVACDFLFNCAGLHCDRILEMAGEPRTTRIIPFRGEYYTLNDEGRKLVRNLIYPTPDPRFPFLGVHFTRMIAGGVEAGPNAVLALAREGYRRSQFRLHDLAEVVAFKGFWRFLGRYPSMAGYELYRSLSQSEFCRSLQKLVPEVQQHHLAPGGSGVRAQAIAPDGTPVQDFEFVLKPNALHLINAPSPGATASLTIADYLIERAALAEAA